MPYVPKTITVATVVIDTDKYSGNFQSELCGFLIGNLDSYGSENDECDKYHSDVKLGIVPESIATEIEQHSISVLSMQQGDEPSGTSCEMHGDKAVAIFFRRSPSNELVQYIKDRTELFGATYKPRYSDTIEPIKLVNVRVFNEQAIEG